VRGGRVRENASALADAALSRAGMPQPVDRGYAFRRLLLLSDLLALSASLVALGAANLIADRPPLETEEPVIFLLSLPVWVLLADGLGLYHLSDRRVEQSVVDEIRPAFLTTTVWIWLLLIANAAVHPGTTPLLGPAVLWMSSIVFVLFFRIVARRIANRRHWFRQPVLLIGDEEGVKRVLRRIRRHPECSLDPVGTVLVSNAGFSLESWEDEDSPFKRHVLPGATGRRVPTPDKLAELVGSAGIRRVIITDFPQGLVERTKLIRAMVGSKVCVDLVSGEPEALISTAVLHHLEGLPMLTIQPTTITRLSRFLKRGLDVTVSGAALLLLSPYLAYVAVRIKLDSPGPTLFRQQRAGRDGEPFEILKFRTMVDGADTARNQLREHSVDGLFKLRDDPRVTRYGGRLRRRSADELPQLWNVLRGSMSLVGPRPLPLDEAYQAQDHFAERLDVRPGITGPWQVLGRSDIPFEDMVKLDYTYVAGWTMREDIRLLAHTASTVLGGRGAY
jgi:exopolysaccharide biosynthesis polyprenyl glycosylphosphotransferase